MKYVMFTNEQGYSLPVFAPDIACHCDMKGMEKGWVATSAGMFNINLQKTHGTSISLEMSPHSNDANICLLVIGGFESMLMMAQDLDANKARREQILKARKRQCCERDYNYDGNCDRHPV